MIYFTIPIRAPSTPNQRLHWAQRAKQAASQKRTARASCPAWTHGPLLVVKLTRVAPRQLDSDNCAAALKAVRDGIATWLRIDDGSPLVRWEYDQAKGEPCVNVCVCVASKSQTLSLAFQEEHLDGNSGGQGLEGRVHAEGREDAGQDQPG